MQTATTARKIRRLNEQAQNSHTQASLYQDLAETLEQRKASTSIESQILEDEIKRYHNLAAEFTEDAEYRSEQASAIASR